MKEELIPARREILNNPHARQIYHEELKTRRRLRRESELDETAEHARSEAAKWRLYRRMGKTLARGGCL